MRRSQAQKLYVVLQHGSLTVIDGSTIFTPNDGVNIPELIDMSNNPFTLISKIYLVIEKMNRSQNA